MEGHEVTVIEMLDSLAPDAGPRRARPSLLREMEAHGVRGVTGTRATRIADGGLYAEGPDGSEMFFPADTVLCAAGRRPESEKAYAFHDAAPYVRYIGDCVQTARVYEATTAGYCAALDV
jgi:pyruvate/2-oxoglutarate dehydrogenase complex dihydrolipoamide dehydrogenase (E3) component